MKYLLMFFLLVLSIPSHALDVMMYSPNNNQGRIELSSNKVPKDAEKVCGYSYIAKAWGSRTNNIYGCWRPSGDTIIVIWFTKQNVIEERTYYMENFILTDHGYKTLGTK